METPFHSTPVVRTPPAPLPEGVTRCPHASPDSTLANCWAVRLELHHPSGAGSIGWIVWRDPTPKAVRIKPLTKERITDLRPGDRVEVRGAELVVRRIEVLR
ncbi:hypothetical protein KOR34_11200 [Posidoniimonas corsicana]|uniref:Uncharacterized protein n=1 Tax=Posidoniimonas corsicana TaxID=1938618 RepID=A0A5C5VE81_9BACT|nr:hypothetical protein [Posidoniimonas corsicana]TWT36219.1 hypothetical protein KOR34_11200 [Posidoniimonas corsicana]